MSGLQVNIDFIGRNIDRVRFFFLIGTGKSTEKFSAQNMVRIMEGVRVVLEVPSTGTEFPT